MNAPLVFVDQSGQPGGAEMCLRDIAPGFRGVSRVVLFQSGPFAEMLRSEGIPVDVLSGAATGVDKSASVLRALAGAAASLTRLPRLRRMLGSPRTLYLNTAKAIVLGRAAFPLGGPRLICHLHDLFHKSHFSRANLAALVASANRCDLAIANSRAAARHDLLVANSENVQRRIRKHYGRESVVVHPPVNLSRFAVTPASDGSALIVSRLLSYKNIDLAVRAFSGSGRRLVIVGEGPDRPRLERMAGEGIEFVGRLDDNAVRDLYARCRMFILPGEEDFGITPLEAMACGKPVVALARGGATESLIEGATGVFFHEESPAALAEAVKRCESISWNPDTLRARAMEFSEEAFARKMQGILSDLCSSKSLKQT
jgi:glycosyltransferase involved in cell wall biosynthesis